jgi:hypothetical protein
VRLLLLLLRLPVAGLAAEAAGITQVDRSGFQIPGHLPLVLVLPKQVPV